MAKALAVFAGHNMETAKRVDGVWFTRTAAYNGYGMGWSKWEIAGWVQFVNEKGEQYRTEGVAHPLTHDVPDQLLGSFAGNQHRVERNVRLPN